MASKPVTDAVAARIAANWSRLPVVDANGLSDAPQGGYLVIEFPIAQENQNSLGAPGNRLFRENGALRLVMSIPIGAGSSPYDEWFEELRTLFRAVQFDGVNTWAPSPAAVDDRNDQGSFYKLSCAIPYYFDFVA